MSHRTTVREWSWTFQVSVGSEAGKAVRISVCLVSMPRACRCPCLRLQVKGSLRHRSSLLAAYPASALSSVDRRLVEKHSSLGSQPSSCPSACLSWSPSRAPPGWPCVPSAVWCFSVLSPGLSVLGLSLGEHVCSCLLFVLNAVY